MSKVATPAEKKLKLKTGNARESKNWLEWTIFGFSCATILFTVGYLTYATITHNPQTLVDIEIGPVSQVHGQYQTPFTVQNIGGEPIQSLKVLVSLKGLPREEANEFDFTYLPAGSRHNGIALFEQDPRQANARVETRVSSYHLD